MAARLVRVVLLVAALAVPQTVGAVDTLGARLSPVNLVVGRDSSVSLTNKSTVPVRVHVDAIGDGWTVDTSDFALGIGQAQTVRIATVGSGDATIRASLTSDKTGTDNAALVVETHARHPYPWESVPPVWLLVPLLGLLAVLVALRRSRNRRA